MILVPVKNLANAKQRLSSVLGPEARQELARAMCADVLETLARWRRSAVAVVSSDLFASNFAEGLGFEVIADDESRRNWRVEMPLRFVGIRAKHTLVIQRIFHDGGSELEDCGSAPLEGRCWCRMRRTRHSACRPR
jgi:2-phospho-L-lactate guanylyltransferase (CobY/MobA/RfbA family)